MVVALQDRPERFVPMVNAARSPTFYEFDSMDLLRLYREMESDIAQQVIRRLATLRPPEVSASSQADTAGIG